MLDTLNQNQENAHRISPFVKKSFFVSYMVLFASTLITFIEAIRTKSVKARHILNLETAVSVVAGYMYLRFLDMLDRPETTLDDITRYRYLDWSITTPMLLLALMLFFNFDNKNELHFTRYGLVILLNAAMLTCGYMGEKADGKKSDRGVYNTLLGALGFVFYVAMLSAIWFGVVRKSDVPHHRIVFIVFSVIWAMYGVAFYFDQNKKNLMYNTLDVISKSMFGLFMWLYYGGVVDF